MGANEKALKKRLEALAVGKGRKSEVEEEEEIDCSFNCWLSWHFFQPLTCLLSQTITMIGLGYQKKNFSTFFFILLPLSVYIMVKLQWVELCVTRVQNFVNIIKLCGLWARKLNLRMCACMSDSAFKVCAEVCIVIFCVYMCYIDFPVCVCAFSSHRSQTLKPPN